MNSLFKLKPKELLDKNVYEIEKLLIDEALRLGFTKDTIITYPSKSKGTLISVTLTGNFRLVNNHGKRLELVASIKEDAGGISLFKEELFSFNGDEYLSEIPWILYDSANISEYRQPEKKAENDKKWKEINNKEKIEKQKRVEEYDKQKDSFDKNMKNMLPFNKFKNDNE